MRALQDVIIDSVPVVQQEPEKQAGEMVIPEPQFKI